MASAALAVALLSFSLLTSNAPSVSAAPPIVAGGTLTACNGEQNVPGVGVRCTVSVLNYLTGAGALSAVSGSSWTVTRCTGATGALAPVLLPAATCVTTTLATVGAPISIVQLCNGSGNGGGGAVWCSTTIANHFDATPAAFTPATIYECVLTVPGMLCSPTALANTAVSVPTSIIGQCNGSAGGGGLVPAVPLLSPNCAIGAGSTTTATAVMNVDQCNGSANGGGAVLKCFATVTNIVDVIAPPAPPAPQTDETTTHVPAIVPVIVQAPAAAPVAAPVPPPVAAPLPVIVAPTATPVAPQQAVPTPTVTPTATPSATPTSPTATPIPPRPAPTGNAGPDSGSSRFYLWIAVVALMVVSGMAVLIRQTAVARRR